MTKKEEASLLDTAVLAKAQLQAVSPASNVVPKLLQLQLRAFPNLATTVAAAEKPEATSIKMLRLRRNLIKMIKSTHSWTTNKLRYKRPLSQK